MDDLLAWPLAGAASCGIKKNGPVDCPIGSLHKRGLVARWVIR